MSAVHLPVRTNSYGLKRSDRITQNACVTLCGKCLVWPISNETGPSQHARPRICGAKQSVLLSRAQAVLPAGCIGVDDPCVAVSCLRWSAMCMASDLGSARGASGHAQPNNSFASTIEEASLGKTFTCLIITVVHNDLVQHCMPLLTSACSAVHVGAFLSSIISALVSSYDWACSDMLADEGVGEPEHSGQHDATCKNLALHKASNVLQDLLMTLQKAQMCVHGKSEVP